MPDAAPRLETDPLRAVIAAELAPLVRRIDAARFYTLIYLLMIATGAKLVWDGLG